MPELSTERVLIAGCGKIGVRVGQALAARGATVWGLRRRTEALPPPLQTLRADLTDPETLFDRLPEELDLVYYIVTPEAFDDEAYRRAYVAGLDHLLTELRRIATTPRRVILVSSTAVYGQIDGGWVDETSPTKPTGFAGQRMREAERRLLDGPFPGTAVRFGGIYGRGRERMLRKVRSGEPCIGEPVHYTNRIHEDDAVGALVHLAGLDAAAPLYLGVDDAPCSQCELMDWLADQLGHERPARTRRMAGGQRGGNKRCRNTRLRASGFHFAFPTYREGYRALIDAEANQ